MSSPQRFSTRMIVFLVGSAAAAGTAYEILFRIYMYNPVLNGFILAVLLVGIVYIFRRVFVLKPEIRWIEAFRTSKPGFSLQAAPRLLAPVAAALGEQERRGRFVLPAMSARYLLDSISARLDESRDISRYQIGHAEVRMEDPIMKRRDRTPTISVRSDIGEATQPPEVSMQVMQALQPLIASR